jgi:hypothetical protein
MKTKTILLFVFASFLTISICGQKSAVVIKPKKVEYERKGAEVPEYKKTFEVNYPEISGVVDPQVRKNLEETLSFWKNFDMTLEENLDDYHWLESLDYDVTFQNDSVLVIDLRMEGSGAYPDSSVKTLVVDLKTGRRIYFRDAFTDIGMLLVKIDQAQFKEKEDHLNELKRDSPEDFAAAREMLDRTALGSKVLEEFSVDERGVTFIFDYGFPHVAQALEPSGRYFFSWTDIKPHIRRDGLLGQFVR